MAEEHDKPERSFKVQDRRRFTETGDARGDEAAEAAKEEPAQRREEPAPEPKSEPDIDERFSASGGQGPEEPFEINFATFVISLSTQALAHLGEMPNPIDGMTHVDLIAARQIIDIIGMLRDKTKGNLDEAESALLDSALYDLRMKYVERAHAR
jgi:hypothetical protein